MSNPETWDLAKTGLLTIDLQNDFIHPDGAYGRAGQAAQSIAALPRRIAPLVQALRARGAPISRPNLHWFPARMGNR